MGAVGRPWITYLTHTVKRKSTRCITMSASPRQNICKFKRYLNGNKLIIVSNREPYSHEKIRGKITEKRSIGGVISALDPVMQACGGTWVSWGSGNADFDVTDEENRIKISREGGEYTLKRIALSEKERENYYFGFSNRVLWPLSHFFSDKMSLNSAYWKTYEKVNHKFADAVLNEAADETMVWVHDYHLALVPGIIKRARPDLKVSFFWHIVWPSLEIYQRLPWRREILRGLLGNDMLGFHTKLHADNFLRCVEKLTPYKVDWEHSEIEVKDRSVKVGIFPIGIDAEHFEELSNSRNVRIISSRLKKKLTSGKDVKIIFGIDRLDYTKGVLNRLRGYERFLKKYPKYRKKVIFAQLVTPSRSQVREYKQMKSIIDQNVGRINAELERADWVPIRSYYRVFSDDLLISYYKIADIALVTPLADGMNLVAKEYIAANKGNGSLILSEFAGAAERLKKAFIINPYDPEDVADAIKAALERPAEERKYVMGWLKDEIMHHDVYWWLDRFFRKWKGVYA